MLHCAALAHFDHICLWLAVSTLVDDIKSLEDIVEGDWGPDNVFWSLKGKSFEETFGQYRWDALMSPA